MSEANVEIVRRLYADGNDEYYGKIEALHEALENGDFGEFMPYAEKTIHQDAVLVSPANSAWPEGGTREWRGREGILRFLAQQAEAFEAMSAETEEFIDAGDKVVVPVVFGGRTRTIGLEARFSVVHVLTIRDGKMARMDMYATRAEALEAVGLTE
jgi:ketosteroid isomerase-like protein